MLFEWGEAKNAANKVKHGISFEEVVDGLSRNGVMAVLPNPTHPGQLLIVFRLLSGKICTAAIEPRGEKFRLITAQVRRKMRKIYGP